MATSAQWPQIGKDEWGEMHPVKRWWLACRGSTLLISVASCAISAILVYRLENRLPFVPCLLVFVGCVSAHAVVNMLNDLVDWEMKVDSKDYFRHKYGSHPMKLMTFSQMVKYISVTSVIAIGCAVYFIQLRGQLIIYLTLAGTFVLVFYTYPLKHIGLGEISVLVTYSVLMIGGGYFAMSGKWSWQVVFISLPNGIGATIVLFGKHMDKSNVDRKKRIYTLPVILGRYVSGIVVIAISSAQYIIVLFMLFTQYCTPLMAVVFVSLPSFCDLVTVFSHEKPKSESDAVKFLEERSYPHVWPLYFFAFAITHFRTFGRMFLLGLLLDTVCLKWILK